ncbi:hypothetical protein [Streptomyces sp. Ac-502]|uniref:hypothetical protein n=1 Tax=Streptomyces sp. Ac-502 TaxID=3342801 RepID=UPI0038623EEB
MRADDHPVADRRPPHPPGRGRMAVGVAWAVLLLGLWLWGRDLTDDGDLPKAPTTGDVAAAGRPIGQELPAAHAPWPPPRAAAPPRSRSARWAYGRV